MPPDERTRKYWFCEWFTVSNFPVDQYYRLHRSHQNTYIDSSEKKIQRLTSAHSVPWSGVTARAACDCNLIAASNEEGNGGAGGIAVRSSIGDLGDLIVSDLMIGIDTSRTSLVVISIDTCLDLCGSAMRSGWRKISWSMSVTRSDSSLW